MTNIKKALVLSLEGIEGCGKSTQTKWLQTYFERAGKKTLVLREPGGTEFGENLRQAILQSQTPLHPLAEAHLFCAARAQLITEKVTPVIEDPNTVVIIDRFIDSSLAYQGVARGLGFELVLSLHKNAPLTFRPDITFYLKIDAQISLRRQKGRGQKEDYFEKEKIEFTQKLIEGFDLCAKHFPERIYTLAAGQNEKDVSRQLQSILETKENLWN